MKPPVVTKIKKEFLEFGNKRIDNYFWLNQKENPAVIALLKDENKYTETVLKHTEALQEKIYREIINRIKREDISVPYKNNGYYYYTKYNADNEYPLYCRKKGSLDAFEEIILDVNLIASGFDYCQVADLKVSPNNKMLAYSVDNSGSRIYEINFKDLQTGSLFRDKIPSTNGSVVWMNDGKSVFYCKVDDALRPYKVFRHKLGKLITEDEEIYHEKDETFITNIFKTKSKKYILIGSYNTLSTEIRFFDAGSQDINLKVIQTREKNLEYYVDHLGGRFYITTNLNAKNFKLVFAEDNNVSKENWREIIPAGEDVLLESIELFNNHIVALERKNGLRNFRIVDLNGHNEFKIDFNEETYTIGFSNNPEPESLSFRFNYNSLTTPGSIFELDLNSGERSLLKQEEVPGGFSPDDYKSERVYAVACDGTKIPISLVYKKGMQQDGTNPLLLYGYGSYGISSEPGFNRIIFSLLDRGFIYAIAHIRGGQELGRQWYEDGKLLRKKNTFTDFIASAEYLLNKKYTCREKLFAKGMSAGGLLIGAAVNMRPELFKGVIAGVPFVDVITTMLDVTIPLTTGEYDEWGNPNVKEYYDYMLSYSPYDNVRAAAYPNMLVITGLNDSQVQYWEPVKWVAKLREMKTDDNLILLHINMAAGHGGASGRFERYHLTALEYGFIFYLLGITE